MLTLMIRDLVVTFVVLMLAQGVRCLATSHASFIASSAAMPHFSSTELSLMDRLQKQGSDPGPIFKAVNAARHRQRAPLASSSAVYRYLAGCLPLFQGVQWATKIRVHRGKAPSREQSRWNQMLANQHEGSANSSLGIFSFARERPWATRDRARTEDIRE